MTTLTGEITDYKRFASGWTVMTVRDAQGERQKVVGSLPPLGAGMNVEVIGQTKTHAQYGPQIVAETVIQTGFAGEKGAIAYLASKDFANVGVATATAIVRHFGDKVFDILDADPEKVMDTPGATQQRLRQVADAWSAARQRNREISDLMRMGLTSVGAYKARQHFGEGKAVEVVREYPYRLTEIPSIGFETADKIALSVGILPDSPRRIAAALQFTLERGGGEGHCYLPQHELAQRAAQYVPMDNSLLSAGIQLLKGEGKIEIERGDVYTTDLYVAECEVASRLLSMSHTASRFQHVTPEDVGAYLPADFELTLDEHQMQAVSLCLNNSVSIITGGPGTGKTTIVRTICAIMEARGDTISLCSPTGRAAKRLTESTGRRGQTIHKLLEWNPQNKVFARNESNPLDADVILADESSMVDIRLGKDLLRAVKRGARLVLIGDANQLPSVGPGNFLRDVISSGVIPVARLHKVYRQGNGSTIVSVAHDILRGHMPKLPAPAQRGTSTAMLVQNDDPAKLIAFAAKILTDILPAHGFKPNEIQVLTPMNKHALGTLVMNKSLQNYLNPSAPGKAEFEGFRVGDRVAQIKNNYNRGPNGVFNGDVGYVEKIEGEDSDVLVYVSYPDIEELIPYDAEGLDELRLAFASTVHRSQGSEYEVVILMMHDSHSVMLQRNLLYTGLTRAKKLCFILGTQSALDRAAANGSVVSRNTNLSLRLIEA